MRHAVEADGEQLDADRVALEAEGGDPDAAVRVPLEVFEDRTKTVINRVQPTRDVPFDWTLNPYRGCEHGCVYCFARPFHEFLGFSCGLDFETKLTAKPDAPELLRRELSKPSWSPAPIAMSAITDIYQPLEAERGIARACLEVFAETRHPVMTLTKGALSLIRRDLGLWSDLAAQRLGWVTVTIVTLDDALATGLEPRAAPVTMRLRAIRELADAGVPVNVNISPVIPALTDSGVPAVLEAVADAGATSIRWNTLRLPHQLKDVFTDWLERVCPDRRDRVLNAIRAGEGGKLYDHRRRGQKDHRGPAADATKVMIQSFVKRYGLDGPLPELRTDLFQRPSSGGQMGLFG